MVNKCDQCFYALMDKESEAPCVTCRGYSNFVSGTVYATEHSSKPLKEAIDDWFNSVNGLTQEDYDSVTKPRHYMLFDDDAVISYEGKGIEVRDVLKKLSSKLKHFSPMFIADYVQMMQYGMRFMDKNGLEDLKKQRWYLDKMIEEYEHHV